MRLPRITATIVALGAGGCAHVAVSALEDLGRPTRSSPCRSAAATLARARASPSVPRGSGNPWGARLPGAGCARNARIVEHWFAFSDGGRRFHVELAYGEKASAATRRQAWGILDGLRVDPAVRPDWPS